MLTLYNTRTRKKEIFKPINKNQVGFYSCGATVYGFQHIGNLRTYIFCDVLKRTLMYNGYKVNHVMNYTDVGHLTSDADTGEDKVEMASRKEGKTPKEITTFYIKVFEDDLKKLNIIPADIKPKATEHIKEQIEMVEMLEDKGYTYKTKDGIYFDTSKFPRYKDFANLDIEGMKAGQRVDIGEKKNVTDFALWKFSEEVGKRYQEWDTKRWGIGFPAWHIECSAMANKYLGKQFDIHTGGEDHIPVHHTNEIAQSECALDVNPSVNYWLHCKFLNFEGEKISKSKGTTLTLTELDEKGIKPAVFRYFCLNSSYMKQISFSFKILENIKNSYDRLERIILDLKNKNEESTPYKDYQKIELKLDYKTKFIDSINDNLNTPKALSVLLTMLKDKELGSVDKLNLAYDFDKVLGLGLEDLVEEDVKVPEEVYNLIKRRDEAKTEKNYELADIIRNEIKEKGYIIKDTKDGIKIERCC